MSTIMSNKAEEKFNYEKYPYKFVVGEIIHNNNGSDYRVIDTNHDQNKILFENISNGEKVLALDPGMYHKLCNGKKATDVLMWEQGVYNI